MPYPDDPAIRAEHRRYHDTVVNGVRIRARATDTVIWQRNDLRAIVVRHRDTPWAQRRRVQAVVHAAGRDDPFDGTPYFFKEPPDDRDVHLFLLMKDERAIGLLVAHLRQVAVEAYWPRKGGGRMRRGRTQKGPVWTIARVWVLKRFRGMGFGKRLVKLTAAHLKIRVAALAWSLPFTEGGRKLAQACSPKMFLAAN